MSTLTIFKGAKMFKKFQATEGWHKAGSVL